MSTVARVAVLLPVVALAALPAHAVLIQNTTTGQVVFLDDFEGLGANVSQTAYPDVSGNYNPVAILGGWVINDADKQKVQVTNWQSPGAVQGDNYLRLFRSSAFSDMIGTFSVPQTTVDHAGETVHFEWMMYVTPPATASTYAGFGFVDTSGGIMAHVLLRPNGITTNGGGLTYTPDQWMKVEMDYVIGANNFLLTIDGNSAQQTLFNNHAGGGVGSFRLFGHPDYRTYLDAVPEPSTAMLALSAMILWLLRRRR
ncbi:MAG: hypothetical protein U1E05_14575 [Patescibacteria group bacterium]|nr:hypothetical protein [Patescibacteria group bacterium]